MKAEERALEAFDTNTPAPIRIAYRDGYEQAEKDLALTWEDIKTIEQIIATSDWYDFESNGKLWSKEFYEEVLKRFKEKRNEQ